MFCSGGYKQDIHSRWQYLFLSHNLQRWQSKPVQTWKFIFTLFFSGMRKGGRRAGPGIEMRDRILFQGTAECSCYHDIHGFSCGFFTSTPVLWSGPAGCPAWTIMDIQDYLVYDDWQSVFHSFPAIGFRNSSIIIKFTIIEEFFYYNVWIYEIRILRIGSHFPDSYFNNIAFLWDCINQILITKQKAG